MSNIMVYDIVGTGHFAVPETDAAAGTASLAFAQLLITDPIVEGLAVDDVEAWVLDSRDPDALDPEGPRTLACFISGFSYNNKICPSESEVDTLAAAIRVALLSTPTITSVGVVEVNIFNAGVVPVVL